MNTVLLNMKVLSRHGLLYPMLVIAAVSVIIFSALGVATMTGLLPRAESMNDPHAATQSRNHVAGNRDAACANCGVVESIAPVEVKGSGSGLGMVAGGLTGALLGNHLNDTKPVKAASIYQCRGRRQSVPHRLLPSRHPARGQIQQCQLVCALCRPL